MQGQAAPLLLCSALLAAERVKVCVGIAEGSPNVGSALQGEREGRGGGVIGGSCQMARQLISYHTADSLRS